MRGLIRDSYADFGPALEAETLRERHSIEISKACVRRIMIDAGFLEAQETALAQSAPAEEPSVAVFDGRIRLSLAGPSMPLIDFPELPAFLDAHSIEIPPGGARMI